MIFDNLLILGMHRVLQHFHHHKHKIYTHVKHHHKKYLWGVAGVFGIFKLFSFFIISISGYIAIYANDRVDTIEIPATTIHIQDDTEIFQFDFSQIATGRYQDIDTIKLHIGYATDTQSLPIETIRNTTTANLSNIDYTDTL